MIAPTLLQTSIFPTERTKFKDASTFFMFNAWFAGIFVQLLHNTVNKDGTLFILKLYRVFLIWSQILA